jgi:rhodanese-related sulfurtransferase
MKDIDVDTFQSIWQEQKDSDSCCLIDVRTAAEYAEGHVPGARLICLDTLAARAHEIPKDKDVYLICRSGARSAQAADYLMRNCGHNHVINVSGGTMAWIQAGYAVET